MTRQTLSGGPALGLALLSLSFGPSVWSACAPRPPGFARAPQPVELPVQPPTPEDVSIPDLEVEPVLADEADTELPPLPVFWAEVYGHTQPFATAIQSARDSKRAFQTVALAMMMGSDGGIPAATLFERANVLLDQTSRRFATAYHAPDAGEQDRLEVLREASQLLLGWSKMLDDAGLTRAPAAYRSSSSVSLTFEDVANGPATRWREEGLALLHLCIDIARASSIDSPDGRECAAMRRRWVQMPARRATASQDSGAMPCACDPGDPLCSASMGGWCRPD